MAAAVLGGLMVSTVLSLIVVPSFYVVSDRIRSKVFKKHAETPEDLERLEFGKEPALEHTAKMDAVKPPAE